MQTLEGGFLNDAVFIVDVLAHLGKLHFLDLDGALIFFQTVAGKDLHINNGTLDAGWYTQRGVLHVRGFLTEDCTQQFFFWSKLSLTLRRYLAHQNVAGVNFSTDVNNAGLVQLAQGAFTDIGNIRSDFFRTQLGITCYTGQFLNVNTGETVFLHHPLGNKDGILKVVTIPGHKGDAHILPKGQFTHIHGRTVSQDITTADYVTLFHQRLLADAGILVGTGVFGEVIDIHTCFTGVGLVIIDANNDPASIHAFYYTATEGHYTDTGVGSHIALHAGTYQRLLGFQGRHSLTLHV